MKFKIAIIRCENLPSFVDWEIPNIDELFEDDRLLIKSINNLGHLAESVVWSDKSIIWNNFDIAIIRSTWDYIDRRKEFLKVLKFIESTKCILFNSSEIVSWNSDKNYLFDLQKLNIPTVPTFKLELNNLEFIKHKFIKNSWNEIVLKPSIGAGGANINKIDINEFDLKAEEILKENQDREILVQPLINSIKTEGEWSHIFIQEKRTHSLLKIPGKGDYRSHTIYGGKLRLAEPSVYDIKEINEIRNKLPFDYLYVRIDVVRFMGELVVMEIESIEPILYFGLQPNSINLFAEAIISKFKSQRRNTTHNKP